MRTFFTICLLLVSYTISFSQARLIMNGAIMNINNGSTATPIYLVVENSNNNAITRNSGHIISESEYNFVKWNVDTFQQAYVFPFGFNTTDYLPFTYDKVDNSPVKVSFSTWGTNTHNNPHPDNVAHMSGVGDSLTSAIDRFWTMQATGPSQAYFTFSYRGSENTTTNPTTSTFSAQYWRTGDWSSQPAGGALGVTAGVGSSTIPFGMNIGQYPFVLTRTGFALPVDLLSFNAKWISKTKESVSLTWESSMELNLAKYEIERSMDGEHFSYVGEVKAAGNSTQLLKYSFIDSEIEQASHTYFYRLKLVDFDNEYKYSNTKALSKTISGDILVNVFPNPTKDHFNVQIEGINVVTELQIRDAIGKVVKSVFLKPLDGLTSEKIDMSEYAKGLYFLHFPMNKNIQTLRIVKN